METIKHCKNLTFEVIYDDGTRRKVEEGVLFEVENDQIIAHVGTGRAAVLFAIPEAIIKAIGHFGLLDAFDKFVDREYYEGGSADE